MDEIRIEGLEIFAWHGVYEEEAENGQPFVVNAVMYLDTSYSGNTDQLEDSVDYGEICLQIERFMNKNRFKLIETVANQLARKMLAYNPLLSAVDIEIQKPKAPIPVKFGYVSVKIHRSRHIAYISFGSNMGERREIIETAIQNLDADVNCRLVAQSEIVESMPYGGVSQDMFLNGILELETLYSPEELLKRLQEEERKAGRERLVHWGPRTLDLDIIYYDDLVLSTPELTIPHVDMCNRDFVLAPLRELIPYKKHPIFGKTTEEMLSNLKYSYIM